MTDEREDEDVAVEKCAACGQRVRIYTSGEGTSSYEPAAEEEIERLQARDERVNDVAVVNCALNPLGMNHPARRALDRLQARLEAAEAENRRLRAQIADSDETRKVLVSRNTLHEALAERDKARADAERLAALIRHATLIHYDVERGEWLTYAVNKADADAALAAHDQPDKPVEQ